MTRVTLRQIIGRQSDARALVDTIVEARGDDLMERAVAMQPDIILLNSVSSARSDAVHMLRFEKGMENVLFLVYQ